MEIVEEIRELAKFFNEKGKKLYLVGGAVRDSIMGLKARKTDYDLCSEVTPRELIYLLEDSPYKLKNINAKVGVMGILVNGKTFEHATFRKDEYDGESHVPIAVKFVNTLEEDVKRRDFKINALYYDIINDKIVDPLLGREDIAQGKITTVRNPKIVYEDDPERILRAIRFSACFGFVIPENEDLVLRQNTDSLVYLSKNRIRREFEKMLYLDRAYEGDGLVKFSHRVAFEKIGDYGMWKYILPSMEEIQKSKLMTNTGETFYKYILREIKNTPYEIRIYVLLQDIASYEMRKKNTKMDALEQVLNEVIEKNLGDDGLAYEKEDIENIKKVIFGNMFICKFLVSRKKIRAFVFDNRFMFEKIIKLKKNTKVSDKLSKAHTKTINLLTEEFEAIKKEGYPMRNSELKIDSEQLIRKFPKIKLERLDDFREEILKQIVVQKKNNNLEDIVMIGTKVVESNPDFFE